MKEVNKKENRKAFFRILKEVRLYPEWARCRKQRIAFLIQLNRYERYDLFRTEYFGDILVYSFGWDDSKVTDLWCKLSRIKLSPSEIVKNKEAMDNIKSIVKKFIDNSKPFPF